MTRIPLGDAWDQAEVAQHLASGQKVITRVNLAKQDLGDMDLRGVIFMGCNLAGTRFAYSELSEAQFNSCIADRANFYGARLREANFIGGSFLRANFSSADLSLATLSNHGDFTGADFEDATLDRVRVMSGIFTAANFAYTSFHSAGIGCGEWQGANFHYPRFDAGTQFNRTSLDQIAALLITHIDQDAPEDGRQDPYERSDKRREIVGALLMNRGWCWRNAAQYVLKQHPDQMFWVRSVLRAYPALDAGAQTAEDEIDWQMDDAQAHAYRVWTAATDGSFVRIRDRANQEQEQSLKQFAAQDEEERQAVLDRAAERAKLAQMQGTEESAHPAHLGDTEDAEDAEDEQGANQEDW